MLNLPAKMKSARQRLINQSGRNVDAVFIWIPKSAGTSVYAALETLGCPKLNTEGRIRRVFPQKGLVTFSHLHYPELIEKGLVSQSYDRKAKKFTIVRDPYDRAISLYFYTRDRFRAFDNWHKTPTFHEYLELIDRGFYDKVGLYNAKGMSQANPQVAWTDGIELDFVGRMEALGEAMAGIEALLGRPLPELEWLNRGERASPDGLLDAAAIRLIDRIYEADFDRFGYARRTSAS